MAIGKIIGGIIGLLTAGFGGAILGLFVGHLFDNGLRKLQQDESPEALRAIQHTFFTTTFTLIGYLAKADGRVSQEEINQTQELMDKMGLTADHKREAIRLFKAGADTHFDPKNILEEFRHVCGQRHQLKQMLIVYLVNTALADGEFDPKEESALRHIADGLAFSHVAFEQLLKMIRAQGSFSGGHYHQQYSQHHSQHHNNNELEDAYTALGANKNDSDATIKRAYRKLMSEYHPDKLMGQGVPEDMIKVATQRSQEVQTAYELIKNSRK